MNGGGYSVNIRSKEGITAFVYGKPESFRGYEAKYAGSLDDPIAEVTIFIFDTTSKYIKVPRFYYEKVKEDDYEFMFFRQFGVNISESPI